MSTSSRDDEASNPPSTPATTKESGRKKGRKEDSLSVTEDMTDSILSDETVENKYVIDIPDELKHVLVNDWDLVVHQKQLFKVEYSFYNFMPINDEKGVQTHFNTY